MTVSTHQLFRERYMVIYDRGNIRYKKFINGCTITKIVAGAFQIYYREAKHFIINLLRG